MKNLLFLGVPILKHIRVVQFLLGRKVCKVCYFVLQMDIILIFTSSYEASIEEGNKSKYHYSCKSVE